jgi:hypothetical protein
MTIADNGWDSRAWLDGEWLHREPRRPEVRPRLLAEVRLLPWLAPQLPLPVPIPEPTEYGVRHRLLVGEPMEEASTALGRELGSFLRARSMRSIPQRLSRMAHWTRQPLRRRRQSSLRRPEVRCFHSCQRRPNPRPPICSTG